MVSILSDEMHFSNKIRALYNNANAQFLFIHIPNLVADLIESLLPQFFLLLCYYAACKNGTDRQFRNFGFKPPYAS